ncbi:HflC protein [Escherichia coli]|nr:HflC protein [Escherichia coli]
MSAVLRCVFGKVLRDDDNKPLVYEPGLHFKIPFIETVKMLDARIQTMDNQADRFVTKEKKDLIVDSYIKWRISDFSRYYLATGGGDISQAEVLLKRKFSDRLRSEIGRLDVKDIVTDSRGRLTLEVRDALNSGSAGTEDEVTTPAADNAIAEAAERVTAETKGKVRSSTRTVWRRWVLKLSMCVSSRSTCRPKCLKRS